MGSSENEMLQGMISFLCLRHQQCRADDARPVAQLCREELGGIFLVDQRMVAVRLQQVQVLQLLLLLQYTVLLLQTF